MPSGWSRWSVRCAESDYTPPPPRAISHHSSSYSRVSTGDYEDLSYYQSLEDCPEDFNEDEWNMQVAAGKTFGILDKRGVNAISIERSSVYGAAVVMPQIARTSGWALSFTALAIRSYVLLVANIWLQGFLLYMISKEERILDKYGGQMRLCDFGARISDCPDAPNCIGPGGTPYSADRLYDWGVWSTRTFVKTSLLKLFPEKTDEIQRMIDPGEYGVESYNLRIVSVYLFVLGLWADLASSLELVAVLWKVPSEAAFWMRYEVPDPREKAGENVGWSELDQLRFMVAGMPAKWKVLNLLLVWIPKMWLWLLTVDIGVIFLMETSKIEDMIINSVALAFILSIDEVIFATLMPTNSKFMMEHLDDFTSEDDEADTYWAKDAVAKYELDKDWNLCTLSLYARVIPFRLLAIGAISCFFIGKYYVENCRRMPDGSLVAKDVYLPLDDRLPFLAFIFGPIPGIFPIIVADAPIWSMSFPESYWR